VNLNFAYYGKSQISPNGSGQTISLAPNLKRDAVAFDAALRQPLPFREAISALHDVVINDLRFKPRSREAYEQWKKQNAGGERALRERTLSDFKAAILDRQGKPLPAGFEGRFSKARQQYWGARRTYATHLLEHDREVWRKLLPCDPVITVAPDAVFFECFSADESSYGCLLAERDTCFSPSSEVRLGTTNVDYSWDLYHHFQGLRTYREARFRIDPSGFEVAVEGSPEYREEKIDLPDGWLRGFMQLQSAMALPMQTLTISRTAMYSLLAWLRRHKPHRSPRALRFEQVAGNPLALVLEPWETRIVDHSGPLCEHSREPIRVWGTRRLLSLARLLPLAERFEVSLLGAGLPTFWVAHLGPMKFTLGLSGWTVNDWTRSSALDLLAPPAEPTAELREELATKLRAAQSATLAELCGHNSQLAPAVSTALKQLAHRGQVIYDLAHRVYRWRQILPMALGEAQLGPENAELVASREITQRRGVRIITVTDEGPGKLYAAKVDTRQVTLLLDSDGAMRKASCECSHHFKAGLRRGPCRHLLALRSLVLNPVDSPARSWYEQPWSSWKS